MEEKHQTPSVSVVIPALNEAKNLRHVLPLIPSIVSEVILVDGNSIDDTIAVIEHLRTTIRPTIHIIKQTGRGASERPRFRREQGDLTANGSLQHRVSWEKIHGYLQ